MKTPAPSAAPTFKRIAANGELSETAADLAGEFLEPRDTVMDTVAGRRA